MSKKENKNVQAEQMSLFDDFFSALTVDEGEVSFDELNRVIGELNKIKIELDELKTQMIKFQNQKNENE